MKQKTDQPEFLATGSTMLDFERAARLKGYHAVAGIDEAGRGCCAGPVVAAAVFFTDPARIPADVNDSKQLTPLKRMAIREKLLADPSVRWATGIVPPDEIDRINILQATWKAMKLALQGVAGADYALVDGNPVKGLHLPSESIVKGDARSASIAAASIIAKTTRDLIMDEAAKQYPDYAFEVHKGYCTALHTALIRKFGPCPVHRLTFEPVRSIVNPPELEQGELF